MSDRTNPSDPSSGRVALPQENWPITIDGVRYCRPCFEAGHRVPTHNQATRSPYCDFHFREARSSAKRRWREKAKAEDGAVVRARKAPSGAHVDPSGYLVLDPDGAERLRADLVRWHEAIAEVAETLGFAVGSGAGNAMVQQAANHLTALANELADWTSLTQEQSD